MKRGLVFAVLVFMTLAVSMSPGITWAEDTNSRIYELEVRIAYLEEQLGTALNLLTLFRYEGGEINGLSGPHVIIEGANLHVQSGASSPTTPNGLGNIIVGYNRCPNGNCDDMDVGRGGSHNVVIGREHQYGSIRGLVAGAKNTISGRESTVTGGKLNIASGRWSCISGGLLGVASGEYASISGGAENTASGYRSSVSGGAESTASGFESSVSGGWMNTASGDLASVSGGGFNIASGECASISGGLNRTAPGYCDWVAGGLWQEQ